MNIGFKCVWCRVTLLFLSVSSQSMILYCIRINPHGGKKNGESRKTSLMNKNGSYKNRRHQKKERQTTEYMKAYEKGTCILVQSLFTHGCLDDICSSQLGGFLKLGNSFSTGFVL